MRRLLAIAAMSAFPISARAADLELLLKSATGQPVQDAVVTYKPAQPGAARPVRFDWPNVMSQHDIAFDPHVLIVPVGAEVTFPNHDRVRHHVYSFSSAKRFELKLYGGEEARTVRFDKPGVVALGCNIHDRMSGFIVVVDTPYAAKSDAAGHALLKGLPDGSGAVTVWQTALKAPMNTVAHPVTLHGDHQETMTLNLRPQAAMTMSH